MKGRRNPIAKAMNKVNKASVVPNKKKEAALKELQRLGQEFDDSDFHEKDRI